VKNAERMADMAERITLKSFLEKEVKPALGCTEPGAVALAVACAGEKIGDRKSIASVKASVSSSIYKNGMAVGIPGTRGARGNAIAAALGAICGDPKAGLEVLKGSTIEDVDKADKWVEDGRVTIVCDPDRSGVYVLASVFSPAHKAACLIEGSHSNVVRITLDGTTVFEAGGASAAKPASSDGFADDGFPEVLSEALKLADEMDGDDEAFLMEGIIMNRVVAEAGFNKFVTCAECCECVQGSRFGRALMDFSTEERKSDVAFQIRSVCAAASDARMSGVLLPVMSSAGSGNHGITAILPADILGKSLGKSEREIAHAVAVSHIATSFVKRRMGRLSPVCGCSIAAGSGAAAGMTSLMGGTAGQVSNAMSLLLSNFAGMLCDGAKESCALKVGSAAEEAYYCAMWSMAGERLCVPQGVYGETIEETAENIGRITKDGMKTVDGVIIEILNDRYR
jgi:L-cysteine desulfidase